MTMKGNTRSFAFAALLLLVLSAGCSKYYVGYYEETEVPTEGTFATLRNHSSEDTVWYIPDKDHAGSFPEALSDWQKIALYEIPARSSCSLCFDSEDDYITPVETYGISDAMVFYVFRKSDWDSHSWKELYEGRMWAGIRTLTVSQMLDAGKVVNFPFQ